MHAQDEAPVPARDAATQVPPPVAPDSPLADPVLRSDAEVSARRATAWRDGDANVVLLEGDFRFRMGGYGWRGSRAVVRIDRIPQPGHLVSALAIYIDNAEPMGGTGAISAAAPRLLVTASTRGEVQLVTDLLQRAASAPADPFVVDAAARTARYRGNLRDARFAQLPEDVELYPPRVEEQRQAVREELDRRQLTEAVERLPRLEPKPPRGTAGERVVAAEIPPEETVLPTRGAVYLNADRITGQPGQNAVMLIGGVKVVYESYEGDGREVALSAERAVIFTRHDPEAAEAGTPAGQLGADAIAGVYLEDNVVISDGRFTVRAPRMYFDLEENKAILLEAVMFTWDVRRNIPLYLRADVVKQESATSFRAEDALLTTSEFAEPHFAIAADRVVLKRSADDTGGAVDYYYATGAVPKWGDVPLFYFPAIGGANREIPLRRAHAEFNDHNGFIFESLWDVFALSGRPRPRGVELLARIDYQGDHGPGFGVITDYERDGYYGSLNSYLLPSDHGTDDIAQRLDVEHDGDTRGVLRWQHRHELDGNWELSLEAGYVSDPTILEEFFDDEAYEAKEYETSIYLKNQVDERALTLLAKYDFSDLTPQLTTLQAPGYSVEKLPEVGYFRSGTELWGGRLTYFTENRAGQVRIRPGNDDPGERGFRAFQTPGFFPVYGPLFDETQPFTVFESSFRDAYDNLGYPLDWVTRIDSRHELNLPIDLGPADVTPFVVGRLTAYDERVAEFAGEDDQTRFWGQVGVRAATEFSRSFDGVDNALFDVHRLRHILRPEVTVFGTSSTLDSEDLPFYDYGVEEISDASGYRIGMTNTLQTQRGGPGRWRSVDWLVLRTDAVFVDDSHTLLDDRNPDENQADREGIARFFDHRPEFSTGGDHFHTQLLWMVSDTLGVTGELTHSFETNGLIEWRIGATMAHTSRLTSFVDVYELDIFDSQRLTYGFNYQLTSKYAMRFSHRISLSNENADRYNVSLSRRLPRWLLQMVASYDEIDDETTIGLVLVPQGFTLRSPTLPLDSLFSQ